MSDEVIVALVGLLGVVVTAWIGYESSKRHKIKAEQAEGEMEFQAAAMDFGAFMEEWDGTVKEIKRLFNETNIDRFIIFRAWNGSLVPRWTTAVFQLRESDQQVVSYVHFELDTDYVARLNEISVRKTMCFAVADLPPSAIRSVYEAEGITASFWAHLDTRNRGKHSKAVTYCSFSTHEGVIDETTATRCGIIAGRLKGVAGTFYSTPHE